MKAKQIKAELHACFVLNGIWYMKNLFSEVSLSSCVFVRNGDTSHSYNNAFAFDAYESFFWNVMHMNLET